MEIDKNYIRTFFILLIGGILLGFICNLGNKFFINLNSLNQGFNPTRNLVLLSTILLISLYILRQLLQQHNRYVILMGMGILGIGAFALTREITSGIIFLSYFLFIHLTMNIFQNKNKSGFDLRGLIISAIGGGGRWIR